MLHGILAAFIRFLLKDGLTLCHFLHHRSNLCIRFFYLFTDLSLFLSESCLLFMIICQFLLKMLALTAILFNTLPDKSFLLYLIGIMNPHICSLIIEVSLLLRNFLQLCCQRCSKCLCILLFCLKFGQLLSQLLLKLSDLFLLRFNLRCLPTDILYRFCMLTTAFIHLFQAETHRILMQRQL